MLIDKILSDAVFLSLHTFLDFITFLFSANRKKEAVSLRIRQIQGKNGENRRFPTSILLKLHKATAEALCYDYNASAVFYSVMPKYADLEQKAPFATEGVQRYDESSANGGRIKTLIKTEKTAGFQPQIL